MPESSGCGLLRSVISAEKPREIIIHLREGFHQKCSNSRYLREYISIILKCYSRRAAMTLLMWAKWGLTAKSVMFCSWSFLSLNFWCRAYQSRGGLGGLCVTRCTKEQVNGSASCSVSLKSFFFPSVTDEQGINCTLSSLMTLVTKRIFNFAFTVIIIALSELVSELQV